MNKVMADFEVETNSYWCRIYELMEQIYKEYNYYDVRRKIQMALEVEINIQGFFANVHDFNAKFPWFFLNMELFFNNKLAKNKVSVRAQIPQDNDQSFSDRESQLWKIERILDTTFFTLVNNFLSNDIDISLANQITEVRKLKKGMIHFVYCYEDLLLAYPWYLSRIKEETEGSSNKNSRGLTMNMNKNNKQHGFALMQVLLAIALGSIMVTSTIYYYRHQQNDEIYQNVSAKVNQKAEISMQQKAIGITSNQSFSMNGMGINVINGVATIGDVDTGACNTLASILKQNKGTVTASCEGNWEQNTVVYTPSLEVLGVDTSIPFSAGSPDNTVNNQVQNANLGGALTVQQATVLAGSKGSVFTSGGSTLPGPGTLSGGTNSIVTSGGSSSSNPPTTVISSTPTPVTGGVTIQPVTPPSSGTGTGTGGSGTGSGGGTDGGTGGGGSGNAPATPSIAFAQWAGSIDISEVAGANSYNIGLSCSSSETGPVASTIQGVPTSYLVTSVNKLDSFSPAYTISASANNSAIQNMTNALPASQCSGTLGPLPTTVYVQACSASNVCSAWSQGLVQFCSWNEC